MPILIRKISGEIFDSTNSPKGSVKSIRISSIVDVEDYINVPGLTAFLQNFMHTSSVTELLNEGVNLYRIPDDGNHPTLSKYGLKTNTDYTELTISYA